MPGRKSYLFALIMLLCWNVSSHALQQSKPQLGNQLQPFVSLLNGELTKFSVKANLNLQIDGGPQNIQFNLIRFDDQAFDLEITHPDYSLTIERRADRTTLALPKHKVVFMGTGDVDGDDHLAPAGLTARLISDATQVSSFAPVLKQGNPNSIAFLLTQLLGLKFNTENQRWESNDAKSSAHFSEFDAWQKVEIVYEDAQAEFAISDEAAKRTEESQWSGYEVKHLSRTELEQTLVRGVRRALEVLAPNEILTSPEMKNRTVEHGELRWIDGQRIVLLSGTPVQIGRAHGELLKQESERCIDSVLNAFGMVQTVASGRWFRQDLEQAYARLSPHIPADHKLEIAALAGSLGQTPELMQALNVFPELFHCSGFAVFDSATVDGKLYHGRVLDYMTTIGLQDAATTFIVAVDGKIPFANVGYAAFTGSVSGMNEQAISLGEMGGAGEKQWDGAPMATLMRRSLEECSTLDQVKSLWSESPRTCEYYYVFADGKTNQAVGVSATPDAIQFIEPGEFHELLGDGIDDAVVLSAGHRLSTLRQRVKDKHGQIDLETAQWLMSRPVAMSSNLHNVLFVPADGVLYVANADHKHPAAERPYVKIDLRQLLDEIKSETAKASVTIQQRSTKRQSERSKAN